ncbi:MAG: thioredoxin-disulfide reductase [Oscillospiraceae bacterium]|nr:thioredoxin-disulfide reductase [Oscillospiraceae bacterium]
MYDVIIIGAGPAGLSAAIYAGRALLKTLLIEKAADGGQIASTSEIENYPGGLLEDESGQTLISRMSEQAARFGAERVYNTVESVDLKGDVKTVTCPGVEYSAKTVIVATGARPRPIGCENEDKFVGRGISFCATCDANFFRNKEVFVAGGGDAAVEEAVYLTKFARKVTVIHRRDKLRAAKSIQEKAFANEKIKFIWDSVIESVDGDGVLNKMTIRNVKTDELTEIHADENDKVFGLFGYLGLLPNSALFEDALPLENGYISTDEDMKTGLPGVFAAGDIRVKSLRQVITAASDGAIAAVQAEKYVSDI